MEELTAKTPEGISYTYYKCKKCGDEIVDMKQLHNVAEKYSSKEVFEKLHASGVKFAAKKGLKEEDLQGAIKRSRER